MPSMPRVCKTLTVSALLAGAGLVLAVVSSLAPRAAVLGAAQAAGATRAASTPAASAAGGRTSGSPRASRVEPGAPQDTAEDPSATSSATPPGAASAPAPSATLPLGEVLRLYRESEGHSAASARSPRPPLAAAVHKLELAGRLLEGAVQVTAQVEINVLAAETWVTVPLLPRTASRSITQLPEVEGGAFAWVGGSLAFVTDKPGGYAFEIGFLETARTLGAGARAEILVAEASYAVMRLRFDERLFQLATAGAIQEADSVVLYPQSNRFALQWTRRGPRQVARGREAQRQTRPPVESVIGSASASVVSTLDGRSVTRVLYELRLEGKQPIEIMLPEGETLDKVYLNGAAIPATAVDRRLQLEVAPARTGDESARLELLTTRRANAYSLSGRLDYLFPAPSWGTNDLHVTLHLPAVFNYQWSGGSLARVEQAPQVAYSHSIPTPGKTIHLHQQLVAAAPTARVEYTVDLAGSYFQ